jgi:hypothetical protein
MLRLSPRFVAALLWCVIALLPGRGFAAALMAGPVAPATAALAAADDSAALPCHAAPAASDDTGAAPTPHLCHACDLCHAGLAVAPAAPVLGDAPRAGLAALAPAAHPGRNAPDGLFRPPR